MSIIIRLSLSLAEVVSAISASASDIDNHIAHTITCLFVAGMSDNAVLAVQWEAMGELSEFVEEPHDLWHAVVTRNIACGESRRTSRRRTWCWRQATLQLRFTGDGGGDACRTRLGCQMVPRATSETETFI